MKSPWLRQNLCLVALNVNEDLPPILSITNNSSICPLSGGDGSEAIRPDSYPQWKGIHIEIRIQKRSILGEKPNGVSPKKRQCQCAFSSAHWRKKEHPLLSPGKGQSMNPGQSLIFYKLTNNRAKNCVDQLIQTRGINRVRDPTPIRASAILVDASANSVYRT